MNNGVNVEDALQDTQSKIYNQTIVCNISWDALLNASSVPVLAFYDLLIFFFFNDV